MPELADLIQQVKKLSAELDKRVKRHERVEPYLEGNCPLPPAVQQARLTKVYRYLMPVAEAPWGSLIVDSKTDRLEVAGLRDTDQSVADQIWDQVWQPNELEDESMLAHGAALLDGRCYATVWPGTSEDDPPDISLDDSTQMIVEFAPGSRRIRLGALRRWQEGDQIYATLWRPEGIYKFQSPKESGTTSTDTWEQRTVPDEDWPLPNFAGFGSVVPVVEVAVNRRLKSGSFPYARGEFEHCLGLIDRINLLTFLGLVIAFWMGFPLRTVIGEKIRREVLVDDDGQPITDEAGKPKTKAVPPFELHPDSIAQFENPEARLAEFKAADRRNLSIFGELQQLAVISKTPRHYFPMEGGIANIDTDTVNTFEGPMHAAVTKHKGGLGGSWTEVCRLGGLTLRNPLQLSRSASIRWKDHQFRSLAERADAVSKLKDVLPPVAIAEYALDASQDEISRWMSQEAANPLMKLLAAVKDEGARGASALPTG